MVPAMMLVLFLAASGNQYTPTLPGAVIVGLICYAKKKQQIGGWLLYYYWQLYGGALVTVLFFVLAFQSYVPENFDDHTRYLLFLASTVPVLIFYALQLAVATILVSVRTWDLLCLLRWLLVAELAAATVATAIDIKYFPDSLSFDFLTVVPGILWLAYFYKSKRVRHVFKSHDWEVAVTAIYPSRPNLAT